MGTSVALILYQNLLFGEGVESILVKNNFSVDKLPIPKNAKEFSSFTQHPDVLLIEFNYPYPTFEKFLANNELFHQNSTKTILITNIVNGYILKLIRKEKIRGVVLKCSDAEELLFAIRQVAEGKKYYSSLVANLIFKDKSESEEIKVSMREKQILSLLAQMKTTAEIANELSISASTVKTHRRNLLHKFNAKSLLCLLRFACRENLLKDDINYCSCCYKQFLGELN